MQNVLVKFRKNVDSSHIDAMEQNASVGLIVKQSRRKIIWSSHPANLLLQLFRLGAIPEG